MINTKKFDNQNLIQLRKEIDTALRKIENDYDIATVVSQPNSNITKTHTDARKVIFVRAGHIRSILWR
ncbi:MAG: hypothetical protein WC346_18400 [Methanogenium sp.]|jgi:hypothetical protein